MFAGLLVLGLLLGTMHFAITGKFLPQISTARRVGPGIRSRNEGKPGHLLTALAVSEVSLIAELNGVGAAVVIVAIAALGFVWAHSLTTTLLGTIGTLLTLGALTDSECIVDHRTTVSLVLVVAFLAGMLGVVAIHTVASLVSAERSWGLWALGVFGGLQLVLFTLSPGGYSIAEGELGAGLTVSLIGLLLIIVVGIAVAPGFTVSISGAGIAVANLAIDTAGTSCRPSSGLLLLLVLMMTALVTLLRKRFR